MCLCCSFIVVWVCYFCVSHYNSFMYCFMKEHVFFFVSDVAKPIYCFFCIFHWFMFNCAPKLYGSTLLSSSLLLFWQLRLGFGWLFGVYVFFCVCFICLFVHVHACRHTCILICTHRGIFVFLFVFRFSHFIFSVWKFLRFVKVVVVVTCFFCAVGNFFVR